MAGSLPVSARALRESGPLISPSLLAADPLRIGADLERLGDPWTRWLHLDIMDGHFVPNLSYGPALLRALARDFSGGVLDVHLMVEPPERFIDAFLAEGPSVVTVHGEATPHLHRVLQALRQAGVSPGVSLNPGTPVEMILPTLHLVDLVLVMSVNPGFGGQSFLPEVLPKVHALVREREIRGLDFVIQIDGGMGESTVGAAAAAGCDVLVAGSALFGASDLGKAAETLHRVAQEARVCTKKAFL